MSGLTRREFVAGAMSAVVLGPVNGRPAVPDTVVAGGTVFDPASGFVGPRDIAITGGRIVAEAAGPGTRVIDATGKIVTPGLIDAHVHVYPGVPTLGIDPDLVGVSRGVTTLVDAGSSGATNFPGFRDEIVRRARTRVRALLNISRVGMTAPNELALLDYVDVDAAVRTIEQNREVIVGIKVRMLNGTENDDDITVLRRTREAADQTGVPITLHIGGQTSPLPEVISFLRPGDVLTHAFRRVGNILDGNGRVYPEVREAMDSGIWIDIGHGMGNLDFDVAERILDQGLTPQMISSDVHDGNITGPVFDLPTNMSKFMALGMSLDDVIAACTSVPAQAFPFSEQLGSLAVGSLADVAVFDLVQGDYVFTDASRKQRHGDRKLMPHVTLRDGAPYGVARG